LWTGGGRMKAPETAELKQLLRPIFEKYKVNAYICGHEHSLQHIKPPGFTHYFISAPDLRRRPSLFILMADVSPNPRMDLWILHYRQTN
jgi:tartrate-resistant acid phosphatase type 5